MSALSFGIGMTFRPEVMKAGDAALGAWLRLLDWRSLFGHKDGLIPAVVVEQLVRKATLKRLIECELLVAINGDYLLEEWVSVTVCAQEVGEVADHPYAKAKRVAKAERQARYRAKLKSVDAGVDAVDATTTSTVDAPVDAVVDGAVDASVSTRVSTRALSILDLDLKSSLSPEDLSKEDLRESEGGVGETIRNPNDSGIFPTLIEEKKSKTRSTSCPTSEATSIELDAFIAKWKLDPSHPEFEKFLDYHRSKRSLFVDWAAAFRTWARRADQYAPRGRDLLQKPAESGWTWKTGQVIR